MKHFLLTGVFAIFFSCLLANTFFVKCGSTGIGKSWSEASGNLAAILATAQPGDEVWVAKGTYYPTRDNDRNKSFVVRSGVKLYGGFSGMETSLRERNIKANPTVLSGNIGSPTSLYDNSFTVVLLPDSDSRTLLDGFIISDGNANGAGPTGDRARCGAGVYIDGSGKNYVSSPLIQNCLFENNVARDGGAVYLNGKQGSCRPVFRNCHFRKNKADLDGGAAFNDGRNTGKSNPSFIDCIFEENEGNYGGAICNYGGKGESSPQFQNCIFQNNEARLRGGAMFNMDVEGKTIPAIQNCIFEGNKAVAGKNIYTFSKPETTIESETPPAGVTMN